MTREEFIRKYDQPYKYEPPQLILTYAQHDALREHLGLPPIDRTPKEPTEEQKEINRRLKAAIDRMLTNNSDGQ